MQHNHGSTFSRWDDFLRELENGDDDVSAAIAAVEELLTDMYCRSVNAHGRVDIERHSHAFLGLLNWLKVCEVDQVRTEAERLLRGKGHARIVLEGECEVIRSVTEWLRQLCSPQHNRTLYKLVILLETLSSSLL